MSYFYALRTNDGDDYQLIELYEEPNCRATQDGEGNVAIEIELCHIWYPNSYGESDTAEVIRNNGEPFDYNVVDMLEGAQYRPVNLGRFGNWAQAAAYFEDVRVYL